MSDGITHIAGIEIPSTNPVFLSVVGLHILLGLVCVMTGAVAMLSEKRAGRHPRNGTIYFWCLAGVALTAGGLAAVRWAQDYHLFVLGALAFAAACFGREARRGRFRHWVRLHITGMGTSYMLLLTAFYVDNGKEPAALARAFSHRLLAGACGDRHSPHYPCPVAAPAGAPPGPGLRDGLLFLSF